MLSYLKIMSAFSWIRATVPTSHCLQSTPFRGILVFATIYILVLRPTTLLHLFAHPHSPKCMEREAIHIFACNHGLATIIIPCNCWPQVTFLNWNYGLTLGKRYWNLCCKTESGNSKEFWREWLRWEKFRISNFCSSLGVDLTFLFWLPSCQPNGPSFSFISSLVEEIEFSPTFSIQHCA